jgi:hypothetical protein
LIINVDNVYQYFLYEILFPILGSSENFSGGNRNFSNGDLEAGEGAGVVSVRVAVGAPDAGRVGAAELAQLVRVVAWGQCYDHIFWAE